MNHVFLNYVSYSSYIYGPKPKCKTLYIVWERQLSDQAQFYIEKKPEW